MGLLWKKQINSGVKQDCVLSPTLFDMFINDLMQDVLRPLTGVGIDLGDNKLGVLLYADDVDVLDETGGELQFKPLWILL